MKSITHRLDADLDPVAVGANEFLWSRDGHVLAGFGRALTIPVDRAAGVSGAVQAQETLAALAGPDDVMCQGTGPVAFAAFPFAKDAPGELVVPEVLVGRDPEGHRWITIVGDGSLHIDEAIAEASARATRVRTEPQPTSASVRSLVPPEVWRDDIVAVVRDRIKAGELTKAVLARELAITTDHPIDVARVVTQLVATHPAAMVFALDGFVGASPELLVSRYEDVVRAHPLAGTAARASDPAGDQAAAARLLASSKDRWEHRITIEWLLDELLPFCSYVDAEPEPSIVSLPNVHHLGTRVEGRLSRPPASVLELLAALHPTPAVGGQPQADALALIADIERADRGRYAGPVGWVDGAGNGAFAVAIRSAQIGPEETRLFAGVGVVGDSDPAAELAETRAKFQAMLPALLRI